jgi:hypothetical protein
MVVCCLRLMGELGGLAAVGVGAGSSVFQLYRITYTRLEL